MKKIKVALGLSGGVDSAVSAYLLRKQGFDVSCIYLNCYDGDTPGCRGDNDRKDALAVAMHLRLPFRALDFRQAYQSAVIDYFKKEYLAGRTPNPDVICNRDIKFGLFMDWAIKAGFDYIATGHYADGPGFSEGKIVGTPASANDRSMSRASNEGKANAKTWLGATSVLRIPKDLHKDQTYFLWAVPREKFERVLFPLGDLLKTEVREIALKIGLPVAKKKDSTGICFVGEVRVEDFLKKLGVKEKIGEVVIQPRKVGPFVAVGSHRGVWFYTIGQRHGFEINRLTGQESKKAEKVEKADRQPLYVIEKDIKKNRLVVGFGAECYRDSFEVSECNWLIGGIRKIGEIGEVMVRIRHGGELIPCKLTATRNSQLAIGNSQSVQRNLQVTDNELRITVHLHSPQRGIAPGQSAVFYLPRRSNAKAGSKEGVVLGGGIIN